MQRRAVQKLYALVRNGWHQPIRYHPYQENRRYNYPTAIMTSCCLTLSCMLQAKSYGVLKAPGKLRACVEAVEKVSCTYIKRGNH
jgi:hypothetical protein